jgi:hypothetical protein
MVRTALCLGCLLLGCGPEAGEIDVPTERPEREHTAQALPPPAPPAEAGFVDAPPQIVGPVSDARMFYSFRPAEHDAHRAPVIVFFNGGPGAATSGALLPFGTGPVTMHVDAEGVEDNPASWTKFANLLYIDERYAGFSHGQGEVVCADWNDPMVRAVADAGDYMSTLLEFLDTHESLRDNPVVLLGESYGGTRATLMLHLAQNYRQLSDVPDQGELEIPNPDQLLPWFSARMQAHLDLAFPERVGEEFSPGDVAAQFGHAVLIQPNLAGQFQIDFQREFAGEDPILTNAAYDADPYDVRQTIEQAEAIRRRISKTVRHPESLERLLGVELANIEGFPARQRGDAHRILMDSPVQTQSDEALLRSELGHVSSHDSYWQSMAVACENFIGDSTVLEAFVRLLSRTRFFITRAPFDSVVHSDSLVQLFAMGFDVSVRGDLPVHAARPGVIELSDDDTPLFASIRFPTYAAGHMVTLSAGAELGEDVSVWLNQP